MFHRHTNALGRARVHVLATALIAAVGAGLVSLAYAAQGARPHDPLSMAEAKELAQTLPTEAGFPIIVNETVLARLNKVVTDPGRAFSVKESLQRMATHRPAIEAKLAAKRLPLGLLALPLVESGYENLGPAASVKLAKGVIQGAGLWMFIAKTARRYGLKVDAAIDERMDVARETDAALHLLGDEHLKYDDWLLALASYNQGGGAVDDAILKGGTRDAWALVEKGRLNDYLVYVTAGVILMGHPELVE